MPVDCLDHEAVCQAVRTLLLPLQGIGDVDTRPGGAPSWVSTARPLQAHWELDVLESGEEAAGNGTVAYEMPVIAVEGFMPFSYQNPNSAPVWRALIKRVRDQLRKYPTLGNQQNMDGWKGTGLPQMVRVPPRVGFTTENGTETLCHHALIELRGRRVFSYTISATFP